MSERPEQTQSPEENIAPPERVVPNEHEARVAWDFLLLSEELCQDVGQYFLRHAPHEETTFLDEKLSEQVRAKAWKEACRILNISPKAQSRAIAAYDDLEPSEEVSE